MVKRSSELLFGPYSSDIHEGINFARMREERAAKARQTLKKYGLPAMLVSGEPNVRYLMGFSWAEFQPNMCYTLFFAEHEPILFAHAGSFHQMPDQAPWIKHWRIGRSWLQHICGPEAAREEAKLFAKEISQELKKKGLQTEKLGIVGFDDLAREVLKEQGLKVVDGWLALLEASATKTVDEINCLKMTASICGAGWQRILEVLRPGVPAITVRHMAEQAQAQAGATYPHCGLMSGPWGFPRTITYVNRIIEHGDLVYAPMCGTAYMGYHACLYRTFIVGREPTAKEKDWYKQMKERLDTAIEATKVGASTADIAKAFPPASKWGFKDEVEILTVEVGHGIGLTCLSPATVHYNSPVINRQWSIKHPQTIEEGMVIAYESLEGEWRVGGVRMENMVVVTKDGAEIIDLFPREEILVAGGR